MKDHRVETAMEQVEQMRDTVDCLARIQDKSLLTSFGFKDDENGSDQESESDDGEVDDEQEVLSDINEEPEVLHTRSYAQKSVQLV